MPHSSSTRPLVLTTLLAGALALSGPADAQADWPAPDEIDEDTLPSARDRRRLPSSAGRAAVLAALEALAPPDPELEETTVVRAVGDLMMHGPQISAAATRDGAHDFRHNFASVRPLLSRADIAFGNLETTLAGERRSYTGYPAFNSPDAYARAARWAGFDILSTANNHSNDRREAGVLRTLRVLEELELLTAGTYAREEESQTPWVLIRKGDTTLGFLAYTYSTNGIPSPAGKEWQVSMIDPVRMARDIAGARAAGADTVLVSIHWGLEYQPDESSDQRQLAHQMIAAGADVVLGGHPHVQQPMDWVQIEGLDGEPREGAVIYSMGNFISNQRAHIKATGVIYEVTLARHRLTGVTRVAGVRYAPTWVDVSHADGSRSYRIRDVMAELPLCEDDEEARAASLDAADCRAMRQSRDLLAEMYGTALRIGPSWDELPPLEPLARAEQYDDGLPSDRRLVADPPPTHGQTLGTYDEATGQVHIEGGVVVLGEADAEPDEPPRAVVLSPYAIDRTEVRAEQYAEFLVAHPERTLPGHGVDWAERWAWTERTAPDDQVGMPAFLVTYDDARAYCAWRGGRLPTESEWEYAARGPLGWRFPWGDDWAPARLNWFDRPREDEIEDIARLDGHARWAPVGSYEDGASPFGLLDMAGNVAEWVDGWGDREADLRILKGGSWFTNSPYWLRASFRYPAPADEVSTAYGFRCARDLEPGSEPATSEPVTP